MAGGAGKTSTGEKKLRNMKTNNHHPCLGYIKLREEYALRKNMVLRIAIT